MKNTIISQRIPAMSVNSHATTQRIYIVQCIYIGKFIFLRRIQQEQLYNFNFFITFMLAKLNLCTSQIEASTSPPPGQPPGICIFCKIFVQISPSRARKAVQMPHHRSIPGDQMPPPPGNFSVALIMLRKLCM